MANTVVFAHLKSQLPRASVAQLVEQQFCKLQVTGSNPVAGSTQLFQYVPGQPHQIGVHPVQEGELSLLEEQEDYQGSP